MSKGLDNENMGRGDLKALLKFLRDKGIDISNSKLGRSIEDSSYLPSPPPQHWKECEHCRVASFHINLDNVCRGNLEDGDGEYYSVEWLNALLSWAVDSELYEEAAMIRDHIPILEKLIKEGVVTISSRNYY